MGAARGLVLAVPWVWQNSPLPSPRASHELIGSGLRSKDSSAGCAPRCCTCDVTSVKHILWRSRDSHGLHKSIEETYLIVRKLSGSDKADNVNECFARKGTVSYELQHVAAHFPTWLVLCHCVLQFVERLYIEHVLFELKLQDIQIYVRQLKLVAACGSSATLWCQMYHVSSMVRRDQCIKMSKTKKQ